MRIDVLSLVILAGSMAIVSARHADIRLSADTVGQPPKGFDFGHTAKAGSPGKWVVQADGTNKFLAQSTADATRSRFPVAVAADVTTADVDISVRFRPVSGQVDQAAVWSGDTRTKTTTTSSGRMPWKTTSCCTRLRSGKRTDLPLKGEGRTYGQDSRSAGQPVEHAASRRRRDPVRGVLQRHQAVRSGGSDLRRKPDRWASGRRPIR